MSTGVFAVLLVAVAAAALSQLDQGRLSAQDGPPMPPHQYYGDGSAESAAKIDGATPPEGTIIIALDASGAEVGRTTITQTHWLIQVDADDVETVAFEFLGCAGRTAGFPTESGGLTAVLLEASGCDPTIDPSAVGPGAVEGRDGDTGADDAPRDAASTSPTPAGDDGGVDAWVWVLIALLFAAALGAGLFWLRRSADRAG